MSFKNLSKIVKFFCILIPTTSLIISVPVGAIAIVNAKNKLLDDKQNAKWNFDASIINKYNFDYYTNDLSLEYDKNNLLRLQSELNITSSLDSYTRQKSRFTKNPTAIANVKYEKSRYVDNAKFLLGWLINKNSFLTQLNDNWYNDYQINMSSWSASSDKRYVGNVIVVPMYSNAVTIQQNATSFNKIDHTFRDISKDIISKSLEKLNFSKEWINNAKNYLIQSINNEKNPLLKPKLISTNSQNLETKYVNFGNFKSRYISTDAYDLAIKSNNIIPFTTNVSGSSCGGGLCSHNIKGWNAIVPDFDIAISSLLGNDWIRKIAFQIFQCVFFDLFRGVFSQKMPEVFNALEKNKILFIKLAEILVSEVAKSYPDLILKYFGRLNTHGIDSGKCGTLLANLLVYNNEDNYIKLLSDDQFHVFTGDVKKLFEIRNGKLHFNQNTFYSIYELANYSYLYNYLIEEDIPEEIKQVLIANIEKLSVPSYEIYNQFLSYINFGKIPKYYNVILSNFVNFKNEGWKIPNDVNLWKVLKENILSYIFHEKIVVSKKGFISSLMKKTIWDNGKWSDYNINNMDDISIHISENKGTL